MHIYILCVCVCVVLCHETTANKTKNCPPLRWKQTTATEAPSTRMWGFWKNGHFSVLYTQMENSLEGEKKVVFTISALCWRERGSAVADVFQDSDWLTWAWADLQVRWNVRFLKITGHVYTWPRSRRLGMSVCVSSYWAGTIVCSFS